MKRTRTFAAAAAAVILPFALAACGPADDTNLDTADDAGAPAATPAPTETPAATTDMPATTLALAPVGGTALGGEVVIDDANDGQASEITVRLTGSTAGAVHQGHVHRGTCEAVAEVVQPLEPITIGEDGNGEATATVQIPTMTVADGSHIVVYHEADGQPGAPAACVAIPAHQM